MQMLSNSYVKLLAILYYFLKQIFNQESNIEISTSRKYI